MFGERLRMLRIEKGLYQKHIAQAMNITTSAYGFYEQGKRTPDAESLKRLADFFDVSVDYLLDRTTIKEPISKYLYNTQKESSDSKSIYKELPEEAHEELEQYICYLKHKYNREE